jgi:hypothetical protein
MLQKYYYSFIGRMPPSPAVSATVFMIYNAYLSFKEVKVDPPNRAIEVFVRVS